MMQIAAYGRLGQDPREIQTSSGKTMAAGSLAVTLTDRSGSEHTQWISVISFGRVAEALLKHDKGELISVSGRVQANVYQERVELQVIADSVISARTVRPGGGKRRSTQAASAAPSAGTAQADGRSRSSRDEGAPFNDEIPW